MATNIYLDISIYIWIYFDNTIGVEYSKEEFKSTAPESVPLILKTVFSHTPLSNVKMFLQVENSFDNDDDNNNPPVNDEIQSNYVTQLSKVEFRFF